jgi:hypothetical protein
MKSDKEELGRLIVGMRAAYMLGENAMAWARANSTVSDNTLVSTLIAYDLQAGTYVDAARKNPVYIDLWCKQLAELLNPYITQGDYILEVGVGEATTLTGVMNAISCVDFSAFGFDLSWSRVAVGQKWAVENSVTPCLFVGDLFSIPLADNSMDIVYTSHSLEPNGGKEEAAIKELFRIARKAVVLVEPCYELAPENAQQRMRDHGYVRGLKAAAEALGANVIEHRLLDICSNPLNPSGVIILSKPSALTGRNQSFARGSWQCPLTGVPLTDNGDYFYAESVGIAYPVMQGLPLLRPEHAVIASKLSNI